MRVDTHMFALAVAAFSAGLAIGHPWLALFLVFCASCAVDVKTPVFVTAAAMATAGSTLVLVVGNARYGALPLAAVAFGIRAVSWPVPTVPPPQPRTSPVATFKDLL